MIIRYLASHVLYVMVWDSWTAFRNAFAAGRGVIDVHGHSSMTAEELEEVLGELEFEEDFEINYSEFLAAAMNKHLAVEEERLQLAFKKLDIEGRGYLTRESIKLALGQGRGEGGTFLEAINAMEIQNSSGDNISNGDNEMTSGSSADWKIDHVFQELDYNKDGKIEYYEFLRYWRQFNDIKSNRATESKGRFSRVVRKVVNGLSAFGLLRRQKSTGTTLGDARNEALQNSGSSISSGNPSIQQP